MVSLLHKGALQLSDEIRGFDFSGLTLAQNLILKNKKMLWSLLTNHSVSKVDNNVATKHQIGLQPL
jgi:hypothetical protein